MHLTVGSGAGDPGQRRRVPYTCLQTVFNRFDPAPGFNELPGEFVICAFPEEYMISGTDTYLMDH